ncbi:MAG: aldehyde dehydrogenase family protein [Chitinivibrionales bacterium]|nr:aldehyde dehydrogenase family protein [Chitinivibrionales bacterium]
MNSFFDPLYKQEKESKKAYKNFINGTWVDPESTDRFDIINPSTGETIATAPLCTEDHVSKAIRQAKEAQGKESFPPLDRLAIMERAAGILEEHSDSFVQTITCESGKPISDARSEVHATIERMHLAREEVRILYGEYIPGEWVEDTRNKFAIVLRNPLGVVAALSPFNYPLFIGSAKIIPALLAGNSVVVKPASDAPLSLLLFARVFQEAGLAPGILQVLTGKGSVLGGVLAKSSDVEAISFTGSTRAGKAIAQQAGIKRLHLELGGNAAALVLPNADINHAAEQICKGTFKNSGQRCDAVSRVLVHESIHDTFMKAVSEKINSYKMGDPLDEDTKVGPLINNDALEKVERLVNSAVDSGAEVISGAGHDDLFYLPTILDKVTPDMDIAREEIFGPVMPVMTYSTPDEAVRIANSSEYGLDGCLFTENINDAIRIAKTMQDGNVGINAAPKHGVGHFPFGGNKASGMGREGLKHSIDELTRLHTIVIAEK